MTENQATGNTIRKNLNEYSCLKNINVRIIIIIEKKVYRIRKDIVSIAELFFFCVLFKNHPRGTNIKMINLIDHILKIV